jgi:hypothetical protein
LSTPSKNVDGSWCTAKETFHDPAKQAAFEAMRPRLKWGWVVEENMRKREGWLEMGWTPEIGGIAGERVARV